MKKITTHFKIIGFIAIIFLMAQGCIPTTPVGGNPTPNPSSHYVYKVFNQTLYDSVNVAEENIDLDFDSIGLIKIQKYKYGTIWLFSTAYNIVRDSTIKVLVKRSSSTDIFGQVSYNTDYSIASGTRINSNSSEWNSGLYHAVFTSYLAQGRYLPGTNDLCQSIYSGYDVVPYWFIPKQTQNFYVAFSAPILSDTTRAAYGWLQLKSTTYVYGAYTRLESLQVIDGAIETNVGEIYVGNH